MSAASSRGALLALLEDCKANPFEDGYRLVLADWLEENGNDLDQARAELIRCQVHYESLPADDPTRDVQGRRARWLLQRHGKAILAPLGPWGEKGAVLRGLVNLLLSVASLRSKALAELANSEAWSWVEEVQIPQAEGSDFRHLAGSALLRRISSIGFPRSQLDVFGVEVLVQMPWISNIVRLDLSSNPITDNGLSSITRSENLSRLSELNLTSTGQRSVAGSYLGQSGLTRTLRHLALGGNQLGEVGLFDLTKHNAFSKLRTLDLRGNGVGDAGVQGLAASDALPALQVLDLRDNAIGPRGAAVLAASEHLGGLRSLNLYGNPVGPDGAARLVERFGNRVHVSPVRS